MRLNSQGRSLLVLPLLALLLVAVSGLVVLTDAVVLGCRQARVEAGLVTGSVRRQLAQSLVAAPPDSLPAWSRDARLRDVFTDGLALAPSVLSVAVIDTTGRALAHSEPSLVGAIVPPYPLLPDVRSLAQALRVLHQLRRDPTVYQVETVLERGGRAFGTIRVALAGTFLWESVKEAARRGLSAAVIIISLAVLAGILLARVAEGRARLLKEGIAAIREGRFQERLPETGADEFGMLARELNLLGAQFAREGPRLQAPPDGGGNGGPGPALDAAGANQARVLARLGETAAGVAHELRNHLQVVQLELDQLKHRDHLTPEEWKQHVESAARGVESLGGAVRGFLKVARVRPLALQSVQVNDLLRNIGEETQVECLVAGVRLELDLDPALPEIAADPEVLRQAIHNLIRNGLEALSGRDGKIVLRTTVSGGTIEISVIDNGSGFPPEVLDHAFDLFYTTRTDGSGVGLSIVRQSAEMHGGEVEIHSADGRGTEVVLALPLRRAF